jgi:O-antigen/teichoic acid export membrane protein
LQVATPEKLESLPTDSHHNVAGAIGKNTIFGLVSSIFQVGTRFVTVPIVIAHLGLGGYGIWSIIMTAAAYMRFGSAGIKSAFQKYVAEATGSGDYLKTNQLLSTGAALVLLLSVLALAPLTLCSRQLAEHAGVPPEFLVSAARSIAMFAITMVIANAGAAYEAIVMGGHRIDLARKFNTYLCVTEAAFIILALHWGQGLFTMASIMAGSELAFIVCCYCASHRVMPQIHVIPKYVTRSVVPELVRFAGSYQLVGVLQITYGSLLPITMLHAFGANAAGVLALASRLISPVVMCQSAFLVPVLSSGAMIYATGSAEGMRKLLAKSFKVMLGVTLTPLALIAMFGTYLIEAWTGQSDPNLKGALWLISLAGVFQAISWLGAVLYRVSGSALLDNVREVIRIAAFLVVALLSSRLGFNGVLSGLALVEFIAMIFMLFAIAKTFVVFDPLALIPVFVRLSLATAVIVAIAALSARLTPASIANDRLLAAMKVAAISLTTLVIVYPTLRLTGAVSNSEMRSIVHAFGRKAGATARLTVS